MSKRIGILTGGGDAPGLNPAIKYVTKKALELAYEPYGIIGGWKGLLELGDFEPSPNKGLYENLQEKLRSAAADLITRGVHEFQFKKLLEAANLSIGPLSARDVTGWDSMGSTNLESTRTNPFDVKNNRSEILVQNVKKLGLDWIIAMGGEDTLGAAYKLSELGINVIGIPKTIDRDLPGTDYTLGYNTAVGVIKDTVRNLRSTAQSHSTIQFVESMGRHSGNLAYGGGIASGANMILIPEYDPSLDQIAEILVRRREKGSKNDIVIVSEGTKIKEYGGEISSGKVDGYGHKTLGGIVEQLKGDIEERIKEPIRTHKIGYDQRGADPNSYDVTMGRGFGIAAVELIEKGRSGKMVSYLHGEITHASLKEASGKPVTVDIATRYDTNKLTALLSKEA